MTEDEMVGGHHCLDGHDLSKLWEIVKDRVIHFMGLQRVGHDLATEQQTKVSVFFSLLNYLFTAYLLFTTRRKAS